MREHWNIGDAPRFSAKLKEIQLDRGGEFGFDVIEHVGRALSIDYRSESQIRSELAARSVAISGDEISFPGKRFIVYLMLDHRIDFVSFRR